VENVEELNVEYHRAESEESKKGKNRKEKAEEPNAEDYVLSDEIYEKENFIEFAVNGNKKKEETVSRPISFFCVIRAEVSVH
jgi:hypothetical protein